MIKRYNLYFNFFGWRWRNKTITQVKKLILNTYSDLIKQFDDNIYNQLRIDLLIDKDFINLAYFKNGKKFISIREVKTK